MNVRRPANIDEFRAAFEVNRDAWRAAYADILPDEVISGLSVPEGTDLRDRYRTTVGTEHRAFLIAVDTGRRAVVGFTEFIWDPMETKAFVGENEAGLRAIYVTPNRWGEGIGTELLTEGLHRIPPDRERLLLEVFQENNAAQGFYEARGFEPVAEGTFEIAGQSYPTTVYARRL